MNIKSLIRKAKSIAAKGLLVIENVDDCTANWRFSICTGTHPESKGPCPYFQPDKNHPETQGKCLGCGCLLPEKCGSKTNRTAQRPNGEVTHCVIGRWGDLELTNFYREQDGLPLLTFNDNIHYDQTNPCSRSGSE